MYRKTSISDGTKITLFHVLYLNRAVSYVNVSRLLISLTFKHFIKDNNCKG